MGGKVSSTFGKVAAAAAGFFAFDKLQEGFFSVTGAASDLNETINKSSVIFGKNAGKIDQWAKGAAKNLGMSRQQALDAAAGFGDMFSQIGFAGDKAADMSKAVVQMSADLGSFNNLPTEDVAQRISAAFRGEYDSLQALIPNINAARVESEAMAMTGKKNASSLTAQEKAAAVLAIVNKDGARAMGDFANTSDGAANSGKILAAQWEDQKAKIGQGLLPILTTLIGFLSEKVIPGFDDVTGAIGGVYDLLVNGDFSSKLAKAFNIEEDNPVVGFILDARQSLLTFLDGISIDWSSIFGSIKDAAIAAGGELLGGFKTGIDSGDWAPLGESIVNIIGNALGHIADLAGDLFQALSDLMGKVDWVGVGLEIGKQVPTLLAGLALGILNFDLGGLLSGLADHWFEVLMGILAIAFTPAKWIGKIGELLGKIPLAGKFLEWGLNGIKSLADNIVGWAGDVISGFVRGFTDGGPRIVTVVKDAFETVKTQLFVWGDDVISWFKGLPARFVQGAEELGSALRGKFDEIATYMGDAIGRGASAAVNWLRGLGGRVLGALGDFGSLLLNAGHDLLTGLWNGIKNAGSWLLGKVGSFFGSLLPGWVRDMLGIHSPSTVFAEIGRYLMLGMGAGIDAEANTAVNAAARAAAAITDAMQVSAPDLAGMANQQAMVALTARRPAGVTRPTADAAAGAGGAADGGPQTLLHIDTYVAENGTTPAQNADALNVALKTRPWT